MQVILTIIATGGNDYDVTMGKHKVITAIMIIEKYCNPYTYYQKAFRKGQPALLLFVFETG